MNILELDNAIEQAINAKSIEEVKKLITIQNAMLISIEKRKANGRLSFYNSLRSGNGSMENITDEEMDIIYNSGLTPEEINAALIEKGVVIRKPVEPTSWHPFNR